MKNICKNCPYRKNLQKTMDKLRKIHLRILKEITMIEEEWKDINKIDEHLNKRVCNNPRCKNYKLEIKVRKPCNIFNKIDVGDVIYFEDYQHSHIPHIVVGKTDKYADLLVRNMGIYRYEKELIDIHGCLTVDDIR